MFKVGDFEIRRVQEMTSRVPASIYDAWSRDIVEKHPDWMAQTTYKPESDTFDVTIQSWIVKSPHHTIVIDTCCGNDKERPHLPHMHRNQLPYLADLAAVGVVPEEVDFVINTHIHSDHAGWNTRKVGEDWVPTFPNARYLMTGVEYEARDPERGAAQKPPTAHLLFLDSVLPLKKAGKIDFIEGNETLFEGFELVPIPGHAPGQFGVRLRSRGEEAFFVADVLHQPIQVFFPQWRTRFCELADLAVETRAKVLDYCADSGSLMLPFHFGAPYAGYVSRRSGGGFAFTPAEPTA